MHTLIHILFSKTFEFIASLNYFELCVIMLLESTCFPVFIPVEVFIIPMGYLASIGQRNFGMLMIASTIGIVSGCLINYFMARILGRPFIYKYSKYLMINVKTLEKWERKFLKNSKLIMFLGRFIPIPAVKHLITIPAGISKMKLSDFILYNALGGLTFSTISLMFGYYYGDKASTAIMKLLSIGKYFLIFCIIVFLIILLSKKIRLLERIKISKLSKKIKQSNKRKKYRKVF
jgi:membrane protein DedA with SNARE-associated domain